MHVSTALYTYQQLEHAWKQIRNTIRSAHTKHKQEEMVPALLHKGQLINDGSNGNDQVHSVPYPPPKLSPMKTSVDANDNLESKDASVNPIDKVLFYSEHA